MDIDKKGSRYELWMKRIQDCRESGLTQKEWCEQNQISVSSFRYWISKMNKKNMDDSDQEEAVFARLPSEAELIQYTDHAPVILNTNGIRIELYPSCSREMMQNLISVLQSNV